MILRTHGARINVGSLNLFSVAFFNTVVVAGVILRLNSPFVSYFLLTPLTRIFV